MEAHLFPTATVARRLELGYWILKKIKSPPIIKQPLKLLQYTHSFCLWGRSVGVCCKFTFYSMFWSCQGPVPLTVFWSNSQYSGLMSGQLITTKFCECHNSVTVVTCAKFCCDQLNMFWTRSLQSFIEFWIRLKYHKWDRQKGCTICNISLYQTVS